jgi:hypothetical protein
MAAKIPTAQAFELDTIPVSHSAQARRYFNRAAESSMGTNTKQTSDRVATIAGKTLGNSSASSLQKSLAGSALRQAGTKAQTGAHIESKASHALESAKSSAVTRTLAGSVVSQSNRKR